MKGQDIVIEEVRSLDEGRFRVGLRTPTGALRATLLLAGEVPPPDLWTVGDADRLLSDVDDERPRGTGPTATRILTRVAYRLKLAAFVHVPADGDGTATEEASARVSGGGSRGASVCVTASVPIPAKVYAHEGAGDDDSPLRVWTAEIADATPLLAESLARALRQRRATDVDSTARAVASLAARFGMVYRAEDGS
jgi:hypothetical protein